MQVTRELKDGNQSIGHNDEKKSSNERVGGPSADSVSDGSRGVMSLGSKSLASVDDNSSSCGGGWREFVGPRCLLGKVGHSI